MTVFDYIRRDMYRRAGLESWDRLAEFEHLQKSEWSPRFEQLMRQRLLMGSLRYGVIHAAGKPQYDRCKSISKHLDLYSKTGNLEHLVDAANMCLMEFEEGRHSLRHFHAVDDHNHHSEIKDINND